MRLSAASRQCFSYWLPEKVIGLYRQRRQKFDFLITEQRNKGDNERFYKVMVEVRQHFGRAKKWV